MVIWCLPWRGRGNGRSMLSSGKWNKMEKVVKHFICPFLHFVHFSRIFAVNLFTFNFPALMHSLFQFLLSLYRKIICLLHLVSHFQRVEIVVGIYCAPIQITTEIDKNDAKRECGRMKVRTTFENDAIKFRDKRWFPVFPWHLAPFRFDNLDAHLCNFTTHSARVRRLRATRVQERQKKRESVLFATHEPNDK